MWLSILTAKKLDPQWEGRWTITAEKGPLNMEKSTSKVVHVNRFSQPSLITYHRRNHPVIPGAHHMRIILQNFIQILLHQDPASYMPVTSYNNYVHKYCAQQLWMTAIATYIILCMTKTKQFTDVYITRCLIKHI